MRVKMKFIEVDLVVVGAGFAGICSAIQAARKGLKVALINDRGVLGGNASAEIGVPVNGSADGGMLNLHSREGGICSEILLEYQNRLPMRYNRNVLDGVLVDFIDREKNIQLFLNTYIDETDAEDSHIQAVYGTQNTTETRYCFTSKWFVDNTGDGTLGAMVGAEYMIGRESKETFGENIAPDEADHYVLPSTLCFHAYDLGYKVTYKPPDCAIDIKGSGVLERRVIPKDSFNMYQWFYEIGGDFDGVEDKEKITKEHKKMIWGIWDYIKNSGQYPEADNYDIEYMSTIPGTREYRRLIGDYILTEKDIIDQPDHIDTVGHGGWNIDLHAIKGFFDDDLINRHIHFNGVYKIPYRTCYSKNINNLFMCGRCMSTSHVAFGSTRVIATLATIGQAVGMAAYLCKKYDALPRDIYKWHIKELQQALVKVDQLVIGVKNEDMTDMAKQSKVTASSTARLGLTERKSIDLKTYFEEKGMDSLMHNALKPEGAINQNDAVNVNISKRQYKKYAQFKESIDLVSNLALSIPINQGLTALKVLAKATCETTLRYHVYLPKTPENYGPDRLILTEEVIIPSSKDYQWITLPLVLDKGLTYILIELLANEAISLAIGGEPLANTVVLKSFTNQHDNVVSYATMKKADKIWNRIPFSICYQTEPEQKVYEPEQVINGYNRAYGQPNMWLSRKGDKNPTLAFSWDEPKKISQLSINFAIDTCKRFRFECYQNVMDFVPYDYKVYGYQGEEKFLLYDVKNNFKKVNRLTIQPTMVNRVKWLFGQSNTHQIGVYDVGMWE